MASTTTAKKTSSKAINYDRGEGFDESKYKGAIEAFTSGKVTYPASGVTKQAIAGTPGPTATKKTGTATQQTSTTPSGTAAATTVPTTKEGVENQDRRQRLWDSLDYSYGKKREASDKSFAQAYSQADNQMLSRGMQRSSYAAQTLANINKQQIDAQQDIYDAQIADYQNRLNDIEKEEKEDARWQQQFEYQQSRDAVSDNQWQLTFDYGKERDTVGDTQWQAQFDYQKGRDEVGDKQWQTQFDESVRQFNVLHPQDTGGGGGGGGGGGSSSKSSGSGTKKTNTDTNTGTGKSAIDVIVEGYTGNVQPVTTQKLNDSVKNLQYNQKRPTSLIG